MGDGCAHDWDGALRALGLAHDHLGYFVFSEARPRAHELNAKRVPVHPHGALAAFVAPDIAPCLRHWLRNTRASRPATAGAGHMGFIGRAPVFRAALSTRTHRRGPD